MVTADAIHEIVRAITPLIGENMARSAARLHCEKLGIGDAHVTHEQIALLISRLESGLNVFIGRDRASSVMAGVRQTLEARA
jgi:hypothetical protein